MQHNLIHMFRKTLLFILISISSYGEDFQHGKWDECAAKILPEIEFYDKDDKAHLLEEFDDKIVILHFWATWCTICTKEIPELDRLAKDFRKENIKIITLSEDFKGAESIIQYYKNNNIKNLDVYIDKKNQLFAAFKIIGLPTTIFINSKNKEIARFAGKVDWYDQNIRDRILALN